MIILDVIIWTDISSDEEGVQISEGISDENFEDHHPFSDQEDTYFFIEKIGKH